MLRTICWAVVLFGTMATCAVVDADVILDWNDTLRTVAQADTSINANPGWFTRSMAMVNGAMYDVFQAVSRTHQPFLVDIQNAGVSREAAAAQAAYTLILECYPEQKSILDSALDASLAAIPDGPAKSGGITLGQQVASAYSAWRTSDGAADMVPYTPNSSPGRWRPDPMHPSQLAWGPEWGAVSPFTLTSGSQFLLPGPPDMTSPEYAQAVNEVKELGALVGSTRTSDQTLMAIFWAYDRAGMGPPPVLFSRNLTEIAQQTGNSPEANARLFAMASVAMADATIAAWDAKFVDDFWRPISAIREADLDGNPDTIADPNWIPLGAPGPLPDATEDDFTPPFPAYPSGHASMGGALYEILREFYGTDGVSFQLTSQEMPDGQQIRTFGSFSQAELENAFSRVYLGVHFSFDAIDGIALGNDVAKWVTANHFQVVPEPSGMAAMALVLLVVAQRQGRRFQRRLAG